MSATGASDPKARIRARALGLVSLLVPMAVALVVGLRGLTRVSIDRDETATIDIGTRTVPQIFRMIQGADAVHATYYVIMHYWMGWFGTSPTAIRIPSLVGVVIAAGALTLLGWHLLSRRAGITAGILYACAPMISAIAHDARSYGLVSAVAVLTTYALVRAMESTSRVAWIGYGVGVVALVLLHLLTVLILVAHAVTIAWYARRERDWRVVRRWLATVVLAAVPLLPLGYLALKQAGTAGWITRPTWAVAGDAAVNFAGGLFLIGPLVVLIALAYRRRPKAAGSEVANARTPSVLNVGLPWLLIPPIAAAGRLGLEAVVRVPLRPLQPARARATRRRRPGSVALVAACAAGDRSDRGHGPDAAPGAKHSDRRERPARRGGLHRRQQAVRRRDRLPRATQRFMSKSYPLGVRRPARHRPAQDRRRTRRTSVDSTSATPP